MRRLAMVGALCAATCGGADALTPEQGAVFAAAVREEAAAVSGELADGLEALAAAVDRRRRAGSLAGVRRVRGLAGPEPPPRLATLLSDIESTVSPMERSP